MPKTTEKKHRNGAMRPYIVCLLGPLLKRAVFDGQVSPHYDPRIEKKVGSTPGYWAKHSPWFFLITGLANMRLLLWSNALMRP